MAQELSRLIKISGKMYRVTPYRPNDAKNRKEWNKTHMKTVSTRVSMEEAKALAIRCKQDGTSTYAWLQTIVAQRVSTDIAAEKQRQEWRDIRRKTAQRKGKRKQIDNQ